jgi:proteic killer suppression protein
MIGSFANRKTQKIFYSEWVGKGISPELQEAVRRKLWTISFMRTIDELRNPPGNMLKKLSGKRAGQYSIRVNKQWRICFYWDELSLEATEVELVDYH